MARSRRNQGSAFILAVVMVAVLTLIAVSAAVRVRTEASAQRARLDGMRASRMLDAGLARALASLADVDPAVATSTNDEWLTLGQSGSEEFKVGRGAFRFQILDAGSRVNLNTATEEQLVNLPITQEQVDSLLDWREAGMTPRTDGAKDEFYNNLTVPYNAALKRLATFDELMAVKSFDGETLYEAPTSERARALSAGSASSQAPLYSLAGVDSVSSNLDPDGTQRQNINNVQAGQLVQAGLSPVAAQGIVARRNGQGTFENMRQALETPGLSVTDMGTLLDRFSTSTEATLTGRINLNTATEEVLRTVPEISDEAVQSILGQQGTIASLGELANLPGVTSQALPALADVFTVTSSVYLVRVMGVQGSRRVFLEAHVQIVDGLPTVMRRETPPFADMDRRWGWEEEASQTTELVQER